MYGYTVSGSEDEKEHGTRATVVFHFLFARNHGPKRAYTTQNGAETQRETGPKQAGVKLDATRMLMRLIFAV